MKKGCELCSYPARIYCEADGASLCSDCDEEVHSANFLVAKHSRNLLCRVCRSPTPWRASGAKLGPTVSVCESCVENSRFKQGRREEREDSDETDEDFEGEDGYSDEDGEFSDGGDGEDDEEEEGEENQVVPPWSSSPPPPVLSSSSNEAVSSCRISSAGGGGASGTKRTRENADLDSEDEIGCMSPPFNHTIASMDTSSQAKQDDEANSSGFRRSLKLGRQ